MPIPESQLETWSRQGAVTTAKATHESIRRALNEYVWPDGVAFEVYLQGSYKNDTNIRGDSDVDIVVQLNSTFQHDLSSLSDDEKKWFRATYSDATYLWQDFRTDVLQALRDYYGRSSVSEGDKSLKVAGDSGRLNADVVVCLQYRKYRRFYALNDKDYVEGMAFYTRYDNRRVVNYPKLHYANGVTKNGASQTNGRYKPTVRIFKNARTYLVDHSIISQDLAPSYFLECLLYNMPNGKFEQGLQITFLNATIWLAGTLKNAFDRNDLGNFLCQNEQLSLFGNTPEQWSVDKAVTLAKSLIDLWQNWK